MLQVVPAVIAEARLAVLTWLLHGLDLALECVVDALSLVDGVVQALG